MAGILNLRLLEIELELEMTQIYELKNNLN